MIPFSSNRDQRRYLPTSAAPNRQEGRERFAWMAIVYAHMDYSTSMRQVAGSGEGENKPPTTTIRAVFQPAKKVVDLTLEQM